MRWSKSVTKTKGATRKQFSQWLVPKEIQEKLGLEDKVRCTIMVSLGNYTSPVREYKLTSGGEFRLPKIISEKLHSIANMERAGEIIFDVLVDTNTATLEEARDKAFKDGVFDPQNQEDARNRTMASIVRRQGQPEFRRKLLEAYNNRCAISDCDYPQALEAAHIRPYKGKHTNHVKNGVLLRCDLHTLLDLRKIFITADFKVRVCDELKSTAYREFHDRKLELPKDKNQWPDCGM